MRQAAHGSALREEEVDLYSDGALSCLKAAASITDDAT